MTAERVQKNRVIIMFDFMNCELNGNRLKWFLSVGLEGGRPV